MFYTISFNTFMFQRTLQSKFSNGFGQLCIKRGSGSNFQILEMANPDEMVHLVVFHLGVNGLLHF